MQPLVLIADDERVVRTCLARLAETAGFRVALAEDGVEALVAARHEAPDIVVTDLHMPRLCGRQLLRRLRALPDMKGVPILVATADETRRTKIELLAAGADDFLVKPVDGAEFRARLQARSRRVAAPAPVPSAGRKEWERERSELYRLITCLCAAMERSGDHRPVDLVTHIQRVGALAAMIAEGAGIAATAVGQIRRYAGLHDVGKVALPDGLVRTVRPYTPEQRLGMARHTVEGAELLRWTGLPELASNIALCHHERWDGGGYPFGLVGASIPLEARVVSVADAVDGMMTPKPWRDGLVSPDELDEELAALAGSQLDPKLVAAARERAPDIVEIYRRPTWERALA